MKSFVEDLMFLFNTFKNISFNKLKLLSISVNILLGQSLNNYSDKLRDAFITGLKFFLAKTPKFSIILRFIF